MKKISSSSIYLYKRIFPIFWFGFLGFFVFVSLLAGDNGNGPGAVFVVIPLFMAAFGYFIMKNLIFDLIDEVYDEGNSLLFKSGEREVRVDFREIKNVSYCPFMSPPRVIISVRHETEFGKELSFSPLSAMNFFRRNKEIEELIDRIDKLRG